MKNKGLLMIVLLLALCCVLTGYAMTEGATERLEIDANKVANVTYLSIESEVGTLTMDLAEDIDRIVEEVNTLQLKTAEFKISDDDINDMTCLMLGYDESDVTQDIGLFFFPDGRLLVNQGASNLCYTTDCKAFIAFADAYISEATKKYPPDYAGFGFWINIPSELRAE